MPWVQRNASNDVCGVYENKQPGCAEEFLNAANPAVGTFLSPPPPPQSILSQDLMAQFTVVDYGAIKTAVAGSDAFGLLWASLQAQSEPMAIANARFKSGWSALTQVLGAQRMMAIATALGITVT